MPTGRPMTATPSDSPALGVIGAVVPDPRRPDSVRVLVEGRALLTVPRGVAEREGLASGTALDQSLYARLSCAADAEAAYRTGLRFLDRKSTRLNSSHGYISYAVFCLKKKNKYDTRHTDASNPQRAP